MNFQWIKVAFFVKLICFVGNLVMMTFSHPTILDEEMKYARLERPNKRIFVFLSPISSSLWQFLIKIDDAMDDIAVNIKFFNNKRTVSPSLNGIG